MSRRALWTVILVVGALLVAIRAMTGQGMGKAYVASEAKAFVEQPAQGDEKAKWIAAPAGTPGAVGWTEEVRVEPKAYYAAEAADPAQTEIHLSWSRTFGIWVAAFFTLAVLSFLYADNPFYKLAEAVVVGVSAAYWMVVGFWDALVPKLFGSLLPAFTKAYLLPSFTKEGDLWMLVPLVLGILLLCRLVPKWAGVSIIPLAFIIGTTAGLKFVSYVESDLMAQSAATLKPLVQVKSIDGVTDVAGSFGASLKAILIFVGVMAALTYFFFSVEHKGFVGRTARVGIWYLMITFGAGFGFTVMGRIALLAARFEFLFDDWLWLIDPNGKRTLALIQCMLGS